MAIQSSLVNGGIVQRMGLQSTIESPESVSLVKPPIKIIKKVIIVRDNSQ